ncbi:chromosome partitioning protein [Hahella sp. CCB-MM4]|uniref:ParA family protein n=1 Tax=Hahella sp. (strain CCB-MM4) TaxID=1926491 RepID=UPI000B9B3BA5|nr:ParA family protein [Hahella sp. CCB-MM4]OZG74001.1 chromosome partitioning protein [Hahella sp. CCB-MM4]
MKVVAIYNLKGGVGKTATAVNLAYYSAGQGYRTLLWDLDAQAAASWYFNTSQKKKLKVTKLVKDKVPLSELIHESPFSNLDIIPSDLSYRNLDVLLSNTKGNPVRQWLSALGEIYQVIILDCPPSLSELALEVLSASDLVLAPAVPTHLSFETYRNMEEIMGEKGISIDKLFPVLTMIDRRKNLHREFSDKCQKLIGKRPLGYIPYCSDIEKMGEYRAPVGEFAFRSVGNLAYQLLWDNLNKKLKQRS